jgi:hypothetical protein
MILNLISPLLDLLYRVFVQRKRAADAICLKLQSLTIKKPSLRDGHYTFNSQAGRIKPIQFFRVGIEKWVNIPLINAHILSISYKI